MIIIELNKEVFNMEQPEERFVSVFDKILTCHICKHKKFWYRTTLMNTSGMTFLGMEWLNAEAEKFICSKCGYVHWFFGTPPNAIRKSSEEATLHEKRDVESEKEKPKEDGWWLNVKST